MSSEEINVGGEDLGKDGYEYLHGDGGRGKPRNVHEGIEFWRNVQRSCFYFLNASA